MQYEDRILKHLNMMKPGWKSPVSSLTDDPKRFISAVKSLIEDGYLTAISFSGDYSVIKKENISPGTDLYFSKMCEKYKEKCTGGLVFEIGKKPSCKECAQTCHGCIEMRINYGYSDLEELAHLVQKPYMLKYELQKRYHNLKFEKKI